ncbi:ParB/RepB/Spo0J family partition protein [Leptolinea tardivitalis]|uniref:Stage 0 sporulation protein J n=1 Tax=Leptolinea tardivitalis TaxID=229920 RepID=A0A0P6XK18_9CHLR|nr:ParB/RepB/Spo0J family partition protein [Leptolinea tardivitalis]KPL71764.1 stage 0 sporulation protein J [Leptolinea tardivitalis]GAP20137.1 ParB/RepB/Spo0J family partition protein [Leptolinea tardivitalis]
MAYKGGLGRGLDAIIPASNEPRGGVESVPINQIIPNPRQPRTIMVEEGLQELAESIKQHGILQPLIVTKEAEGQYVLIAGERRWRAAHIAGLDVVPVILREANDRDRLELALIENVQRADLMPLETAEAYRQLAEEFNLTHDEIALRVGKSRVAVTNTLRLLKLPEAVQNAILSGEISEGHARALLSLSTSQAQTAVLQIILRNGLSVRQTEELVKKYGGEKTPSKPKPEPPVEVKEIENRLREHLGTRVTVNHGKKGGSLVIYYYSNEELNSVLDTILKG